MAETYKCPEVPPRIVMRSFKIMAMLSTPTVVKLNQIDEGTKEMEWATSDINKKIPCVSPSTPGTLIKVGCPINPQLVLTAFAASP